MSDVDHERDDRLDDGVPRPRGGATARPGRQVDEELLAHVSPAQSENIGLFGTVTVDIDAELAQLDPTGHRPASAAGDGEWFLSAIRACVWPAPVDAALRPWRKWCWAWRCAMESQEGLTGVGKTALEIARARAVESRRGDRLFDDPYADAFVAAAPVGAELVAAGVMRNAIHSVIVRTRFFDDYLQQACAAGCRQVVLLAAGLDSRGFRLTWPEGVRLFELDLPDVLAFKDRVLTGQATRPRCTRMAVPVDLREDWETPLTEAGFASTAPTVWLAEGLLIYLSGDEAARLLTTVGELSAPDSQLTFDHRHPLDAHLTEARAIPALQQYTSLWKGGLGAGTLDWLTDHGWDAQAHDRDDYAASLGRPAPDPSSGATLITALRHTATRPRS